MTSYSSCRASRSPKAATSGWYGANRSLEFEEQVRRKPSAELYTAKFGCAKDRRDAISTAAELVKITDEPSWWRRWIELSIQGENDARVALAYLRVGELVGALSPDLMVQLADTLDRLKLYGEGHRFVQRANKLLANDPSLSAEMARDQLGLFDRDFSGGAAADVRVRAQLLDSPRLEPDALARVGALSYGEGNYQSAVSELIMATPRLFKPSTASRLAESSATRPEDYYVYLALSQLELKQKERALQTFSSMLNLHPDDRWRNPWQMYVEKLAKSAVQTSAGS
jgi:tetratricopeptide (TPR) repeat protein